MLGTALGGSVRDSLGPVWRRRAQSHPRGEGGERGRQGGREGGREERGREERGRRGEREGGREGGGEEGRRGERERKGGNGMEGGVWRVIKEGDIQDTP